MKDRITLIPQNDAEWLLLARKRLNLSQVELGGKINYTTVTISRVEQGYVPMSKTLRAKVEKLLIDQGESI